MFSLFCKKHVVKIAIKLKVEPQVDQPHSYQVVFRHLKSDSFESASSYPIGTFDIKGVALSCVFKFENSHDWSRLE